MSGNKAIVTSPFSLTNSKFMSTEKQSGEGKGETKEEEEEGGERKRHFPRGRKK